MVNKLIKVSPELKMALDSQKIVDSESYEDLIWDLIEDRLEPSEETLRKIEESRKGKTISFEEVKKKLGFA